MFLFDTDHISILQRALSPEFSRLKARTARYQERDFFFSIVSFHEQALGWNAYISNTPDRAALLRGYRGYEELLSQYSGAEILPYDQAALAIFESLRVQRVRIATFDLRIAATALSRDLTLLSRNLADFRQVPGLRVEDWIQ